MNEKARDANSKLVRVIDILEAVYAHDGPARFRDIEAATGMAKGTLHRNIAELCSLGILRFDESQSVYRLGPTLARFGAAAMAGSSPRLLVRQEMERLRDATGETIRFAILDGFQARYVDQVVALQPVTLRLKVGERGPLYCSGTGKAILAAMDNRQVASYLDQVPLDRHTDLTLTDRAELLEDLALSKRRGYSFDRGEQVEEICSMGCAILAQDGEVVGAISITVPKYRMSTSTLEGYYPDMRATAKGISDLVAVHGDDAYA